MNEFISNKKSSLIIHWIFFPANLLIRFRVIIITEQNLYVSDSKISFAKCIRAVVAKLMCIGSKNCVLLANTNLLQLLM